MPFIFKNCFYTTKLRLSNQSGYQIDELSTLKKENRRLMNELIVSKNEIIDNYIGGKSYGMITYSPIICSELKTWCHKLYFANMGKSPIYDVVISYYSPEEFKKTQLNGHNTTDGEKQYKWVNIGNVVPQRHIDIGELLNIPIGEIRHYIFYIGSRNGIYYQELFCTPNSDNFSLKVVSRIEKHNPKTNKYEELKSYIDANFPIEKDKIPWILFKK